MSEKEVDTSNELRVLSLFSGCGGMDLGFEGDFICHRKSISPQSTWVQEVIDEHWVRLIRIIPGNCVRTMRPRKRRGVNFTIG